MQENVQPNLIVAIGQAGAAEHDIAPDALQHLVHQTDRKKKSPQGTAYFEQIAVARKVAVRSGLIGQGKGQSNGALHSAADLADHHPDVSARVLPTLTADLSHITDAQLINLGHQTLHAAQMRPIL